jgi:Cu/Ag efflux protein CusF
MIRTKWLFVVLALALVVILAAPALAAETVKGQIKKVTPDTKQFVLTDKDGKEWTFEMDEAAKVRLADKDVKLEDLKPGDEAEVTYEKKGDKFIAQEVRCQRK